MDASRRGRTSPRAESWFEGGWLLESVLACPRRDVSWEAVGARLRGWGVLHDFSFFFFIHSVG